MSGWKGIQYEEHLMGILRMQEYMSLSKKEAKRAGIIEQVNKGEIMQLDASRMLSLSVRQIRRLQRRVLANGASGIIHHLRDKKSNNAMPEQVKKKASKLLQEEYQDFGPTFASEKLNELHHIDLDPKTVRSLMITLSLWKPRRILKTEDYRAWRERKSCFGEMEQFDGSYHEWFEIRAPKACLLASIDDATSTITHAVFDHHEGVIPVFSFWKQYIELHGAPLSIYVDKFSTYSMNMKDAKDNPDTLTQFKRATKELDIDLICANSPQAKGRIERVFSTLQDRLVKELRLKGISSIEDGNKFLKTYIPKFNAQFGFKPKSKADVHRVQTAKEVSALTHVFAKKTNRVVQNDYTIGFKKQWFQLTKDQPKTICKKDTIVVEEHLDGSIVLSFKHTPLNYKILPTRPTHTQVKRLPFALAQTKEGTLQSLATQQLHKPYIPPKGHPWRKQFLRKQSAIITN